MRQVTCIHAEGERPDNLIAALERQQFHVLPENCDALGDVILIDTAGMAPDVAEAAVGAQVQRSRPVLVRYALRHGTTHRDMRAGFLARGAQDVLKSDASDDEAVTRIRALLLLIRVPSVLVLEDDESIGRWVCEELSAVGMEATLVSSLKAARAAFSDHPVDALIVDRNLPDGDGLDLVAQLQRDGIRTPALIYTAMDRMSDRIEGLEAAGAVDYLCKPVHAEELVARVRVALRPRTQDEALTFGPLELRRRDGIIRWRGDRIEMRPKETAILMYLAERYGMRIPQSMLFFDIWGKVHMEPGSNPVSAAKHRMVQTLKSFLKDRNEPMPDILLSENDAYLFDPAPLLSLSDGT